MTEDLPIDHYRLTITTVIGGSVERYILDCQQDELEFEPANVGGYIFHVYKGNAPGARLELRQDTIVSREVEVFYQEPLVADKDPQALSPDDIDEQWRRQQDD